MLRLGEQCKALETERERVLSFFNDQPVGDVQQVFGSVVSETRGGEWWAADACTGPCIDPPLLNWMQPAGEEAHALHQMIFMVAGYSSLSPCRQSAPVRRPLKNAHSP